jgi:hypothetical protein
MGLYHESISSGQIIRPNHRAKSSGQIIGAELPKEDGSLLPLTTTLGRKYHLKLRRNVLRCDCSRELFSTRKTIKNCDVSGALPAVIFPDYGTEG